MSLFYPLNLLVSENVTSILITFLPVNWTKKMLRCSICQIFSPLARGCKMKNNNSTHFVFFFIFFSISSHSAKCLSSFLHLLIVKTNSFHSLNIRDVDPFQLNDSSLEFWKNELHCELEPAVGYIAPQWQFAIELDHGWYLAYPPNCQFTLSSIMLPQTYILLISFIKFCFLSLSNLSYIWKFWTLSLLHNCNRSHHSNWPQNHIQEKSRDQFNYTYCPS